MAYLRTDLIKNGNKRTPVVYYSCDITGDEICESDGWFGNNNIHISNKGIEILIEQWIVNYSRQGVIPLFLFYLEKRLLNKIKVNRYIPNKLKKEVLKKFKNRCCFCGSKLKLEYDHIIPLSKGGITEISNLQLLCKTCNLKKSNKL